MQYEKVILEMLSRIQTLEDEVKELKARQMPAYTERVTLTPPMPHRTNGRVTEEMLEACYQAGQKAIASENAEVPILAEQVHSKTGMNRNNAIMTIFAIMALLNGELYKRAISGKATAKFFDNILRDYGKGGLQRAIAAMRLHIEYRRTLHHNVDLLEQTCDWYQKKL